MKTADRMEAGGRGRDLLTLLVLLTGIAVALYPTITDRWNGRNQRRAISGYAEAVDAAESGYRADVREAADAYNAKLYGVGSAAALNNPGALDGYDEMMVVPRSNAMGYIVIECIDVELPIYHGTGDTSLARGAGHLEGSSLPVGGENTHCVISAHRGLPSARMFTDLDRLEEGDNFELHVLGDVMAYEVDRIETVLPAELEYVYIEPGEDLCTLLTCTPYGRNTHRLLVRGHRVPYEPETETGTRAILEKAGPGGVWVAAAVAAAAAAVLIISQVMVVRTRKRRDDGPANGRADERPAESAKAAGADGDRPEE